jgi:quercetin dioxygenase-like cupin family protein
MINTLIKRPSVDVIRTVLPAGKVLSERKAPGEVIVQCLEGNITFTTMRALKRLRAANRADLAAGEAHGS